MWQKDFWLLADGYGDLVINKVKTLFYPAMCMMLFSTLHSDTPPKPTEKIQDIPVIQPMQYRYHDGFILPNISHDE